MSLDALRENTIKVFQNRADQCTSAAISITAGAVTGTDQYAMTQIERLAMARAYLDAQKIITDEFRKLTQPEDKPVEQIQPKKRAMY